MFNKTNDTSSIVLPGWAILVELDICIALAAGPKFSSIRPAQLGINYKFGHKVKESILCCKNMTKNTVCSDCVHFQ